jgi:hypothetical protein
MSLLLDLWYVYRETLAESSNLVEVWHQKRNELLDAAGILLFVSTAAIDKIKVAYEAVAQVKQCNPFAVQDTMLYEWTQVKYAVLTASQAVNQVWDQMQTLTLTIVDARDKLKDVVRAEAKTKAQFVARDWGVMETDVSFAVELSAWPEAAAWADITHEVEAAVTAWAKLATAMEDMVKAICDVLAKVEVAAVAKTKVAVLLAEAGNAFEMWTQIESSPSCSAIILQAAKDRTKDIHTMHDATKQELHQAEAEVVPAVITVVSSASFSLAAFQTAGEMLQRIVEKINTAPYLYTIRGPK